MAETKSDIFLDGAEILSQGLTAPEKEIDEPVDPEFRALHGDSYRFGDDQFEIAPTPVSDPLLDEESAEPDDPEPTDEPSYDSAAEAPSGGLSASDTAAYADLTEALQRGPAAGRGITGVGAVTGPNRSYFAPPSSTTDELADTIAPQRKSGVLGFISSHRVLSIGAAVVVAIIVLVAMRGVFGGDSSGSSSDQVAIKTQPATTSASKAAGPRIGAAGDGPIKPKWVKSGCPAGSTAPELAFDGSMDTAWTCVMSYGTAGQVLRIELDGWYVIEAMTIVPGFNAAAADGTDQWIRYQTVSRVLYEFNDPEGTGNQQDTLNLRDEVVTSIRTKTGGPVVASALTVTIQSTAVPVAAAQPAGRGGTGKPVGPAAATTTGKKQDPTSFAVSEISIVGHKAR